MQSELKKITFSLITEKMNQICLILINFDDKIVDNIIFYCTIKFKDAYEKVIFDVVFLFLNEVIEKKKSYSGAAIFSPSDFIITKRVGVWLRDKIWYHCYVIPNKGQKWIDDQYNAKPDLQIGNLFGMRQSANRAKDIKSMVRKLYLSIYLSNLSKRKYIIVCR